MPHRPHRACERTERRCPHCHTTLWAVRARGVGAGPGGWRYFPRGYMGDALCALCAPGLTRERTDPMSRTDDDADATDADDEVTR